MELSAEPINLSQWFNFIAFDLVGDLTFGKPFDCLETGKMHVRCLMGHGKLDGNAD